MRIFFTLFFGLMMTPMRLQVYAATCEGAPISGYLSGNIGGIPIRLPLLIARDTAGKQILAIIGSKKIPLRLKRKRTAPSYFDVLPPFRQHLRKWREASSLSVSAQIGLESAAATACLCGALRIGLSLWKGVAFRIAPQYGRTGYVIQIRCIAVFRLGKLCLTALLLGLAALRRKIAGGAENGAGKGQADQRSNADSAGKY